MKRLLACLLMLSLLVSATLAVGCADTEHPEETTEAEVAAVTTAEPAPETTEAPGDDDLELDPSLTFSGETITMLLRADRAGALDEFIVDEKDDNGDTVKTAIIARQSYVEEKLGIKFAY